MTQNADIELDLTGLQCPMPLLKAKLALNNMESQQVLKVVATDPGSEKDFHLFVEQSDHQILDFQKDDEAYFYWIQKG
ncbi:MAG: sulfurtransferase TusA family protein [Pseudomonadales bacterium]|nr:sulfurtransferase TusA family protein [Pseudomonadales bacterium]